MWAEEEQNLTHLGVKRPESRLQFQPLSYTSCVLLEQGTFLSFHIHKLSDFMVGRMIHKPPHFGFRFFKKYRFLWIYMNVSALYIKDAAAV